MNELAKQAFDTNNFDLSAEIIERSLIEEGANQARYLCLGDSYARSGRLEKSFAAYSQAIGFGNVQPSRFNHLVRALVEIMAQKDETKILKSVAQEDIFACYICKSLWTDPVSLKCGHTFCRQCLQKDESTTCKACGISHKLEKISAIKTNVLLAQSVEKWFPQELEALHLKAQGTNLFKEERYKEAVEYFSRALSYVPDDHLLVSNRSLAYASIHQYEEALHDAHLAISLRPDWPKGYFRKGVALSGLGKHEEAAFAYLQCLSLDEGVASARSALGKSLHKMMSPIEAEDHFREQPASSSGYYVSTSPLSRAFGMPSSATSAKHSLSLGSLQELKHSLQESLTKAGLTEGEQGDQHKSKDLLPSTSTSAAAVAPQASVFFQHHPHHQISLQPSSSTSLPSSSNSSPQLLHRLTSQPKRSPSESDLHNKEFTSRKRSNEERSKEPISPVRCSTPSKHPRSETSAALRQISQELCVKEDFECSLCMRLLYMPVTTPCGHAFCRQCLDRVLDHSPQCPLCKSTLVEYLAERRSSVTDAIEKILMTYFPAEHEERKGQHEEELAELARMGSEQQSEVPVFVCTLAFPQLPCPLHVFEPRYRLMIRQVMEAGTRQFGMCMGMDDDEANFSNWGTMLEIRDVQYFPDGRSVVDCMGGRRFKVIERGTRDGYNTAKVEFLNDKQPENEQELTALRELHNKIHTEASQWFLSIPGIPRAQIVRHFGTFPAIEQNPLTLPNGPTWHWWLCAVLPLDPRAQISILSMGNLTMRLRALQRVLDYVKRRAGANAGL